MKITKFEHSCVLVEDGQFSFLIDPGIQAWNFGDIELDSLPNLDAVIVTHKHGDHLAKPFVEALVNKYPDTQWIAASDAHEALRAYGVTKITNESVDGFRVAEIDHAEVEPFGNNCKNLKVDYLDKLSIVGDTLDISESKDILLLPVQAPWGTTVMALDKALQLAPKYIIPVHDWMWNKQWKDNVYSRFADSLASKNTKFIEIENNKPVDIDL
jgi:L-ascorbate metabolism protein UlaG (beta-lactamase superfamily)